MSDKKSKLREQNKRATKQRLSNPLNQREITIIQLICQEMTAQEIADMLGKSRRTIETDIGFIRRKIGCKNICGIVMYAFKKGIVE